MSNRQSINEDVLTLTPSNSSQSFTLTKNYTNRGKVAILNMSTKEVYVKAFFSGENTIITFPDSASVPAIGNMVPPNGGSYPFELPQGAVAISAIHPDSGGTGNLYIMPDAQGGD